jgi:antitoxin (DNA-binding transcriptional repressor) of toxin-antitoxin stability system
VTHEQVTLRELHENTGTLVREAVRLGGLVVTDRGTPIARIEPALRQRVDKPFQHRRILPAYQELLDTGALRGGMDSTQMIREDRDSR